MATNDSDQNRNLLAIDFIDPLFAVVVSIALVRVMDEPWFKGIGLFSMASAFDIGVLALGGITVVLSWVGYHQSIMTKPILLNTRAGFWRFILDVVLLLLYWLLLVKFQNFWLVLLTLALIHIVFVGWDWLKQLEYPEKDHPSAKVRRGVTVFWFVVFVILFLAYSWSGLHDGIVTFWDWLLLLLALVATGAYRLHKKKQIMFSVLAKIAP